MAWAPKLVRRAKGEPGDVRAPEPGGASSSSMAFSSMAASDVDELVDMLARRAPLAPTPPALTGEAPDRPRAAEVDTDRRRRRFWSRAAEVMGPGKIGVPVAALETELLRKMLESVADVTELRRFRDMLSEGGWLSLDAMATRRRGKKSTLYEEEMEIEINRDTRYADGTRQRGP